MRIAQIAPLWERVPPKRYGGVEAIVSDLTEELVRRKHSVTLFASGDSETSASLRATRELPLNADVRVREPEVHRLMQMVAVLDHAESFDIINSHVHSNTGCLAIPFLSQCSTPVVHTIHCFGNSDNNVLFARFAAENYVSVSHDQRRHLPDVRYVATVHHGIDVERFSFRSLPADPPYLAFLGRLRQEKGAHHAIEVARRVGLILKLAGRVKQADHHYFERAVKPHIDGERVEFLGELGFEEKTRLMAGAAATLIPTDLPEPFGLVTIESMACGTPVVAMPAGAVHEIVAHGRTGFIARSVDEMAELTARVGGLNRVACREHVTSLFSLRRMADDYERVYQRLIEEGAPCRDPASSSLSSA
jgi:glycosyltransferase involved in cell wall biosynthesis